LTERTTRRPRRGLVAGVIVLASIVGFLAVFAVWAKRQLLESNTWADTSSRIIANKDVQVQVSAFLTDTLFANAPIQQNLEQVLPPRAAPAAPAIAGALRQLVNDLALRAVATPKFQELWRQANEQAHRTLIDVVEKGGSEDVNLDLGSIADQLGQQAGVENAASKLPANAAQIKILDNSDLVAAQKAIHLLETLAWVLTLLTLALYGLAIYLANGWRRIALRNVGIAFILVGIVVLVLRSIAGHALVNHLAGTEAVKPAVSATWNIGTSLLKDGGGAVLFYGIVILLGAWIAGPGPVGRSIRREIAPLLASRATAYGSLAVLLLLLFAWSPTPGFERLATSILIILLFVVGLEFLRRQTLRDFPEENMDTARERWSRRGQSLTSRGSGGSG
jgi:hypothetical protein